MCGGGRGATCVWCAGAVKQRSAGDCAGWDADVGMCFYLDVGVTIGVGVGVHVWFMVYLVWCMEVLGGTKWRWMVDVPSAPVIPELHQVLLRQRWCQPSGHHKHRSVTEPRSKNLTKVT